MKQIIKEELKQFEEEYNIKIISARDTGSRSWNLNSDKSDYDVSFIYTQPFHDYLAPTGYKQNIDRKTQTQYDIEYNSWNLDRFLSLLSSSNPSAIEFLQSNKIYYEPPKYENDFMHNLENHAQNNFKPLALMKHHHNLAKNQYERYLKNGKKYTVKRHIYAIRSLMYREYVKQNKEIPTINFEKFVKNNFKVLEGWASHRSDIRNLVKKKQAGRGKEQLKTPRISKKIGAELKNTIPDEDKPGYAQQNINDQYLNNLTEELIKAEKEDTQSWKKNLKSTWNKLTKK